MVRPPTPPDERPPAARLLGRRLIGFDADTGTATLEFRAKPGFTNRNGTVQGGLLSAMLDSATGSTLMASLPPAFTAVTVRLTTDFLKPAPVGPLRATARIVAQDERNAEVEAEITTVEGDVLARATAQLRILRRREAPEQKPPS